MKYDIQPENCSHANVHKEVIGWQRSGDLVCKSCGSLWASGQLLDADRARYEKKKRLEEIARTPLLELNFDQLKLAANSTVASSIEQRAFDKVADLVNAESVSCLTARTNAFSWGIDTFEVDPDSIEVAVNEISCNANVQFAGEQDENSPPCGDVISGRLKIVIGRDLKIELTEEDLDLEDY
jgi:hypothetical protein